MKHKVVIIGHGYTSRLGLIRSLADSDCEITVISMVFNGLVGRLIRGEGLKPIDCRSKYVKKVYYCPVTDGERLIQLLMQKCSDPNGKVVIIPDSDFSAAVVDKYQDKLSDSFLFPTIVGGAGLVEKWMDKVAQKQLARQIGMSVADGHVISVSGGHYSLPSDMKYPCFSKALATISGGKQFLKRCDDVEELRRVLDRVSARFDTKVLVEDFKKIDKEYAVVGLSDGKEVVIPAVIEFVKNTKSHFGIACKGVVVPTTGFEDIIHLFQSFVRSMGFCGLFDIDFYESGGTLYFSEMNLRFGGSGYAVTKAGVNLPLMYVKLLYGEDFSGMRKEIVRSLSYVNERMVLDDYLRGYLQKEEFNALLDSADVRFVYDPMDPKPQKHFQRYVRIQRLKRLLKNGR